MQAASPGLEFVGRILGYVEGAVDTGLFQCLGVHLWVAAKGTPSASSAAEFTTAVANEYQLNLLLETGRVVDIFRGDGSAAEQANV